MKIVLSNRSGEPIYEQIKKQVQEAILSGELAEGDQLPSIRQLARELTISVITTTRAYADLEEEGFVTNVQGKGCYVLAQNRELAREHALRRIEQALEEAIAAARTAGVPPAELIAMLETLYREEPNE